MTYIVRDKDQWGAIRCKVDGDRIWLGEYISGMADMTITADPYDSDRRLVRRGTAQGEVLYCIVPNPHGDGFYVRERDLYGRKLYFVETSCYDEDALLVRKGDQYGSVVFYVEKAREYVTHDGLHLRKKTWLDKAMARALDLLFQAFLAPKKLLGKTGAVVAILGWIAFLFMVGLMLGLPGWYSILFGLLVMWGMFQIGGLYSKQ